jgi:hypothetical protein
MSTRCMSWYESVIVILLVRVSMRLKVSLSFKAIGMKQDRRSRKIVHCEKKDATSCFSAHFSL